MWLEILEEIPPKVSTAVVEPQLLVHRLDLGHVVRVQSEVPLIIGPDSRRGFGLGQHRVALGNGPGCRGQSACLAVARYHLEEPTNSHLCASLPMLLRDFTQDRFVDHLAKLLSTAAIQLVLVSERRVVRDMDALVPMPVDKVTLLQPWMAFDLMHGRRDAAVFQQILHLIFGEIRHPDGFCLAGMEYLLHGFIRLVDV